jgi:hypothetical protein
VSRLSAPWPLLNFPSRSGCTMWAHTVGHFARADRSMVCRAREAIDQHQHVPNVRVDANQYASQTERDALPYRRLPMSPAFTAAATDEVR